jgi:hypothetical protein
MSGSNSSAPASAPALDPAEPLSFTVHAAPDPLAAGAAPAADTTTPARRTRVGRWKMLGVLAVCAAPVVASYFTYFVIRPEGRTNYGALVAPTRAIPADLALLAPDGARVPPAALKGQWLLVAVGPAACDAACEKRLYTQRQLREMLGRERDRVEKLWLVTGEGTPSPALLEVLDATPAPVRRLRADAAAVGRWLEPQAGQPLEAHLYVIDPMGEWMMRFPPDPEPARVKRDLDRLLRASGSWDHAGRP